MYKNLKEYIARLEREGELARVSAPVDPVLEIAEITDRESKRPGGGRALLFENTGTGFPVLTNMMGSDRRIAMALGVNDPGKLTARIEELFTQLTSPKPTFTDKLRMLPLLGMMSQWLPRNRRGRGACQQVVLKGSRADLNLLPILKCWPYDGGRFVTLPLVNTLDPDTGIRNVGMYRMQVFGPDTTGMHWHLHKTGERHYRGYKKQGRRMPVAVCLGGDPAYTYAATAPMPDNMDEYLLAGFLRGRPVELVRCLTNEIRIPADCDFVIEGYVDPDESKIVEGPFGDHTGFYSLEDYYPVFHVTAITHRRDAVYPATIVGVPPQEDAYIAKATEKIFLAPIRMAMLPEVTDLYMPEAGVAHNIAVVNLKSSYPGQGLKTVSSLWGAGQMMFNKYMVAVSTDADVRDPETLRTLLRRTRIPRDIVLARGPLDVLDHAAPELGFGGKMAFDLTDTDPELPVQAIELPEEWEMCGGVTRIDTRLREWSALIVNAETGKTPDIPVFLKTNGVKGIKFVIIMDKLSGLLTPYEILWASSSNCDPSRDVTLSEGLAVFDARAKIEGLNGFSRRWPNIVASSAETIALVDRRWEEYGLGDRTDSPSLKYLKLHRHNSAGY